MEEIVKLKVLLCKTLLQKQVDLLTDTEVEILFQLAKDVDIQKILRKGE